jgi:hypothetical protein
MTLPAVLVSVYACLREREREIIVVKLEGQDHFTLVSRNNEISAQISYVNFVYMKKKPRTLLGQKNKRCDRT